MSDYVTSIRKLIGHETLLTVGCGAIIENENGEILLQRRKDRDVWCLPGGLLELGETLLETTRREVYEETNLEIFEPKLFGIYAGEEGYGQYPNGDKIFSVQIIFLANRFDGQLIQEGTESAEHRFFSRKKLPANLNFHQSRFILDWSINKQIPIFN